LQAVVVQGFHRMIAPLGRFFVATFLPLLRRT
jgi:hypothetical protein